MENQTFLKDYDRETRLDILRDGSEKIEQTTYMQPLTPDELDAKREQLAEILIKHSDLNDELYGIKSEFKGKMKPLKEESAKIIGEIKTKQSMKSGTLYHIANHESGMMESYDELGEFVSMRRLRPDEKQANLFVNK